MTPSNIELYLLPGTMCDERVWQQVIKQLPAHFICHYIALPTGDNIDEIVAKLRDVLPTSPINLIGFSLGGYLAAQYALTNPKQIARLMILANSPTVLPPHEIKSREAALMLSQRSGYRGVVKARVNQLLAPHNRESSDIHALIKSMDNRGGRAMFEQQLSATTERKNLTTELSQLKIKLRFVIGRHDTLVDHGLLQAMTSTDIETVILEDCGHMSPLEDSEAVAQQISAFF